MARKIPIGKTWKLSKKGEKLYRLKNRTKGGNMRRRQPRVIEMIEMELETKDLNTSDPS